MHADDDTPLTPLVFSWMAGSLRFGPHTIPLSHVFYTSASGLSSAFVNLKPLVPYHVLVVPTVSADDPEADAQVGQVERLSDLSPESMSDLASTAQHVLKVLQTNTQAPAFTLSCQDGIDAGQTVPHVHFHVLPRFPGDFERNDDVYAALDAPDEERTPRTSDVMAQEATLLRSWMDAAPV